MVLQSLAGMGVLLTLAWLFSENRRRIEFKVLISGLLLQMAFAGIMFHLPLFKELFLALNKAGLSLEAATTAGTSFVFGFLGGGPLPYDESFPGASFVLAFKALPLVLVVSALSSLLFYWKILPVIVKTFSWILQRTMNVGGPVGLSAAANVFLGMVEAPLFIRPYLKELTRSELFVTMACGMANVAGTVMVLYAALLGKIIPDALGHILIASIISTPAAIVIARLMIPETEPMTTGALTPPQAATSSMDAVTRGTMEGVNLLISIISMLIVLIALVFLANQFLGLLPHPNGEPLTLQRMLGWIMAPVVWLIGIPWAEAQAAGALMGTKTILNEFIAYVDLANLSASVLSPRSRLIMTYALCGFANLGSLGIMLGGLCAMVPERRKEIVSLGFKSIIAGTLASLMTGAVAGIFYR